ncbi:MAG: ABC transporter ATP-binding protein, partial [Cyclobacteriaceae bacterium]|nr:ABC transporter ATP-binding protein [Cyclobacteriaceae bacterium]
MNSISLQTENLVIGYTKGKESTLVLEDINVSCGQSELICLMGGNGSGKSTLLRTLSGLQNPLSGDVFIEKKNIDAYDPIGLSRKLSITLPTGTVTGNMNVKELVALGRYPYLDWKINFTRQDNDIVNRALVMTNTEKIRDRMCHELSDGQLQKVFIARAIAQDTPLMILDEPANHLDLNNRLEMMRLLTVLAKDHEKSIIVSTHHLDLALQLA